MAYTLFAIPGVKLASGKAARGSKEMAAWLPVFIEYMWVIHGIKLVIIKVADLTATAVSSTTHLGGWALDKRSWNLTIKQQELVIYHSTRLGMPNHRRNKLQGFDPHFHGMLNVGYSTPCSYQIAATLRGRDGLARNGPDLDKAFRPLQSRWLNWKAGIDQMNRELAAHRAPTPTTPTAPPEEDMALSDTDISKIVNAIRTTPVTANGKTMGLINHLASGFVDDRAQSVNLAYIQSRLEQLGDKMDVAVDEKAIVAGVVASIMPMIRESVIEAAKHVIGEAEQDDIEAIAVATADELMKRLPR